MKPPFILVPDTVSHDSRECLLQLHTKSADVMGIAYAVMFRGRKFIVNTAGELHRNPVFARGLVAILDDELSQMVWKDRT